MIVSPGDHDTRAVGTHASPVSKPGAVSFSRTKRSKGDRIPQHAHRRNAVLKGLPCRSGHQVRRAWRQGEFVAGATGERAGRGKLRRRHVGSEFHPTDGVQRDASDDVVLRGVAMTPDGRTRVVFVDERHGEALGLNASPRREALPKAKKEGGQVRR